MKFYTIYIVSLCLLISTLSVCSNILAKPYTIETIEDKEIKNDEFDTIIDYAIQDGALSDEISVQKPSKFELFLRNVAIVLILKPYIAFVLKYRAIKEYLTHYLQNLLQKITTKETKPGKTSERSP